MTNEPGSGERKAARWPVVVIVLALFLLHGAALVRLAWVTGVTTDEPTLLSGGRAILEEGWSDLFTRFQGPLPLYANQIFTQGHETQHPDRETMFRGRLGLLPFAWLLGAVVFFWTRAAFGTKAALLALILWATQPMLLGYGALLAVDVAHSALVLLALFATWGYLQRPGVLRLLGVGVALGASFATKYLALLFAPVVAAAVAWASFRGARGSAGRRALVALAATLALTGLSLLALHASYGFQPGFAPRDAQSYRSELVRSWIPRPVVGHAMTLVPRPFLEGVDFQLDVSRTPHETFFDGRYAQGHAGYYLGCLAWKTPEPTLLLVAAALLAALLRGHRLEPSERRTWALLAVALALPLAYLSLLNKIQIGIRYVLPLIPMLCILAGSVVPGRAPQGRWIPALLVLLFALSTAETASRWPYLLGYFNRSSGGPALAWKRFEDSNCDWSQLQTRGRAILEERHGAELTVLSAADGPRLGRVALHVSELAARDPRDSAYAYTWLAPFAPIDHVGAAWFLFDIDRESYRRAAASAEDERVRADFAIALAGDDDLGAAMEWSRGLDANEREGLEELRALALDPAGEAVPRAIRRAAAWGRLRRFDLALEALSAPALRADPTARGLVVEALVGQGQREAAIALLRESPELLGQEKYAVLLFHLYSETARFADAVKWMEPRLGGLSPELRALVEPVLEVQRGLAQTAARYRSLR